jgi:dehydrogenase/reductase SDR family member 7B
MPSFKNKTIWITGASSGIGETTAYRFAKDGAILLLTALEKDKLELVSKKCMDLGANASYVIDYDLSDINNIPSLCKKALEQTGHIDVIFNNAGISQRDLVLETDFEVDKKIMDVNYFAPVLMSKIILKSMLNNGGGTIAVTTSIAGKFGFPLRSSYSASKHALYGYFESLHAEYYDKNIRVCFICPGRVQTNISKYALKGDGQQYNKMDEGQASGISADKAAIKIYKAIRKQKADTLVGKKELLMVYLKRFFPGLTRNLVRKIKAT